MPIRKWFLWSIVSATALVLLLTSPARSAGDDGTVDAAAMKSIERMSEFLTHAQCGSTWYQPVYQGGQVSYQVVSPPN